MGMEGRQWSEARHLEPEDLAVLAEGRVDTDELAGAREHLALCRICMTAYADAVRYRRHGSQAEPLRRPVRARIPE